LLLPLLMLTQLQGYPAAAAAARAMHAVASQQLKMQLLS
jgi:hypothetical protein